ncbi:TerB family tellurite resistance protein [Fulvivirga ligni]|uniref:TerB family tellurite resistance protein n=1 Tax=Fulvivirga ligni TaxID=2904246 RepID=UPI001F199D2E|nr:TerB family tellurite resistance protein [Fulvivirga ligni]UII20802.1 TerB family tellurite resistance protein [Fulvivirga ligni]
MRKVILIAIVCLSCNMHIQAQEQEAAQLVLNIKKLQQFKKILENMYKGYVILSRGYNTVKGIAQGNYKLHEVFLDGLYTVNPGIKKYYKIAECIRRQKDIKDQWQKVWLALKGNPLIKSEELSYATKIYSAFFDHCQKGLEELIMVTTDRQLRMSDEERLMTIDRIADQSEQLYQGVCYFNDVVLAVLKSRESESKEIQSYRNWLQP